mmetsp:Transcript_88212/g.180263  ORF Transcript_88212/g.180263 Transcript_88212/m.180263 type:complete len:239 (+) Transcript_88212:69-785(+)
MHCLQILIKAHTTKCSSQLFLSGLLLGLFIRNHPLCQGLDGVLVTSFDGHAMVRFNGPLSLDWELLCRLSWRNRTTVLFSFSFDSFDSFDFRLDFVNRISRCIDRWLWLQLQRECGTNRLVAGMPIEAPIGSAIPAPLAINLAVAFLDRQAGSLVRMLVVTLASKCTFAGNVCKAHLVGFFNNGLTDRLCWLWRMLEDAIPPSTGRTIATLWHLDFRLAPAHFDAGGNRRGLLGNSRD